MYNNWPYTDLYTLNLDWLLQKVKNLEGLESSISSIQEQLSRLTQYSLYSPFIDATLPPAGLKGITEQDASSIQSILNYAGQNAMAVVVPPGTYNFGRFALPATTMLFARGATIYGNAVMNENNSLIYGGTYIQDDQTLPCIYVTGAQNTLFDLTTKKGSMGISSAANQTVMYQCSVYEAKTYGIRTTTDASDFLIVNSIVYGPCNSHNFSINGDGGLVANCKSLDSNQFGYSVENANRVVVSDCRSENSVLEGFQIDNSSKCRISDCVTVWDDDVSTDYGISIFGNDDGTSRPTGIANENVVSGCVIENCAKSCLAIAGNSSYNVMTGNTVRNCNAVDSNMNAVFAIYADIGSGKGNVISCNNVNGRTNGTRMILERGNTSENSYIGNAVRPLISTGVLECGGKVSATLQLNNVLTSSSSVVNGTLSSVYMQYFDDCFRLSINGTTTTTVNYIDVTLPIELGIGYSNLLGYNHTDGTQMNVYRQNANTLRLASVSDITGRSIIFSISGLIRQVVS